MLGCSFKQGCQKRPLCKEGTCNKYLRERGEDAMLDKPGCLVCGAQCEMFECIKNFKMSLAERQAQRRTLLSLGPWVTAHLSPPPHLCTYGCSGKGHSQWLGVMKDLQGAPAKLEQWAVQREARRAEGGR